MRGAHDGLATALGFSLVEVMLVVTIFGIMVAMAIPISSGLISRAKTDSATVATRATLEGARNRAMAERRNFELSFDLPNRIRVERIELTGTAKTLIASIELESGQQFVKFAALPDTPDLFGSATAINFSGTLPVMFTSDGSLLDSTGEVVNGSIFLGTPNQPESARAVTLYGMTGLIRTWKWAGSQWVE